MHLRPHHLRPMQTLELVVVAASAADSVQIFAVVVRIHVRSIPNNSLLLYIVMFESCVIVYSNNNSMQQTSV